MAWKWRFILLVVGLVIGLSTGHSKAQNELRPDVPRRWFNSLETLELEMRSRAIQHEREIKEVQQQKLKAEFEADQKHYKYTLELLGLISALAEQEGQLYGQKWGEVRQFDFKADQAAKAIRQEYLKRDKQIKKHMEYN